MTTKMTLKQFEKLQERFALYANKETTYKSSAFYRDGKKHDFKGYLMGIGVGPNIGHIIIADCGYSYAIHYENVKLPKLAWE